MTEAGKFLHIPVLDRMRESLKDGGWDEALTANDLKSMLDQGIDVALRQDPSAAVSKNLEVEIEGRQAYIEGDAEILYKGAKIFINIDELSLNQQEPGRLGVIALRYGLKLDKTNAEMFSLVNLFGNEDMIRENLEKSLKDPNMLIWKGILSQLPKEIKVTKFALNLEDSKLKVHMESVKS